MDSISDDQGQGYALLYHMLASITAVRRLFVAWKGLISEAPPLVPE